SFCLVQLPHSSLFFFFFNHTSTSEIYTLSLHDALPILEVVMEFEACLKRVLAVNFCEIIFHYPAPALRSPSAAIAEWLQGNAVRDRKSTRLNSSHDQISYAVFCLKKKKRNKIHI